MKIPGSQTLTRRVTVPSSLEAKSFGKKVGHDTGMTEMDWATGAYGDARVTEMGCAMGSIYSGDPGVECCKQSLF